MSKIKSETAKNAVGELSFTMTVGFGAETATNICDTIEGVVVCAEQDAEERSKRDIATVRKAFVEAISDRFNYMTALEISAEVTKRLNVEGLE